MITFLWRALFPTENIRKFRQTLHAVYSYHIEDESAVVDAYNRCSPPERQFLQRFYPTLKELVS